MIPPPQPDSITFTFLLGGKSVCGQEQRPDRCEDCSEMPNCVLDCFYDALSKGVGCASQSSAPTEREIRDKVLNEIFKWLCDMDGGNVVLNFKLGLYSSPQPFNSTGLIHKLIELRTTPEAHR